MATFLATGLRHDPLKADEDEFLQVEKMPVKDAIEMAQRGELQDAKTLAALLLALPHLEKWLKGYRSK
jgi:ADP-ribose pyrophosphatase